MADQPQHQAIMKQRMDNAQTKENGNYDKLNDRLNHVENQVVSVVTNQQVLYTKVENIQGDVTGLVQSFNDFVRVSNQSEKTNWSNVAAWISVAFVLVSALLYHNRLTLVPIELTNQYQQRDIDRQQKELEALRPHATTNPAL